MDDKAVDEFKELFFKECGVKLTEEQAIEYGTRLVRMVKAVYGDNLPPKLKNKELIDR